MLKTSKRKILIFSEFENSFNGIENHLKSKEYKYSKLKGQTTVINRIVKKRLSQNPLLIVSVKAHPKTAYSDYIRVIDQLKIANAKKISIANSN